MTLHDPSELREELRAERYRGRLDSLGNLHCHWSVSGPPAEISNTPEYQALCGQDIHHTCERGKWQMVYTVLLHTKQDLLAISQNYDGARKDLLTAKAMEFDSAIGAASVRVKEHEVERDRIRAEMKQIVDEFYRRS